MTSDHPRQQIGAGKYPILLALAALCAYWNSFGGTCFLDDHAWIVNNPHIGALFSGFLGGRALVAASLTLNYWLDGVNPRGYHAFNLAVHALAGLTIYGLVRRTLLLPRWGERVRSHAAGLAFAVALLWLVHPLNTQAVTYVIQRCESMMGLFYLLTVYCVLRAATAAAGRAWYAAAVLCCAAGMLCKEVMLTAPLVVLLFDWTFLSPSAGGLLRRRWGLYVALAVPPIAYACYIAATGVLTSRDNTISFTYINFGPTQYALSQAGVILYYLRLSIWPSPLCMDYLDWPIARSLTDCWLSVSVVAVLLLAVLVGTARRHWLGFLGVWFFLILAPSSSIIPIQDPAFEHRMYLSLAAVLAACAGLAFGLLDGAAARGMFSRKVAGRLGAATVCLWAVILSVLTVRRNTEYCNFTAMLEDTVATRPANFRAHETLGRAYLTQGRVDDALKNLRESARLKPTYYMAYDAMALCDLQQGRTDEAVKMFQAAIDLKPGFDPAVYYGDLGRALLLRGEAVAAVERLDAAIQLKPSNARYHFLRAAALSDSGAGMKPMQSIRRPCASIPVCPTSSTGRPVPGFSIPTPTPSCSAKRC